MRTPSYPWLHHRRLRTLLHAKLPRGSRLQPSRYRWRGELLYGVWKVRVNRTEANSNLQNLPGILFQSTSHIHCFASDLSVDFSSRTQANELKLGTLLLMYTSKPHEKCRLAFSVHIKRKCFENLEVSKKSLIFAASHLSIINIHKIQN